MFDNADVDFDTLSDDELMAAILRGVESDESEFTLFDPNAAY